MTGAIQSPCIKLTFPTWKKNDFASAMPNREPAHFYKCFGVVESHFYKGFGVVESHFYIISIGDGCATALKHANGEDSTNWNCCLLFLLKSGRQNDFISHEPDVKVRGYIYSGFSENGKPV